MALRIIGAGLGRTGTLSLKLVLEHLGQGPCYHMAEVFGALPEAAALWTDAAQGRADWDAIFDGFVATVDYPGCYFWRELLDTYPDAKVILTHRDPDSWFDSVSETIFSRHHQGQFEGGPLGVMMAQTVLRDFGDRIDDRAFMTDYFRAWNQKVIDTVPPGKLLLFQAKDGWEPLCAFLGVPVPPEPYPRVNSRDEIKANFDGPPPPPEQMKAFVRAYLEDLRTRAFGTRAPA